MGEHGGETQSDHFKVSKLVDCPLNGMSGCEGSAHMLDQNAARAEFPVDWNPFVACVIGALPLAGRR